VVEEKAKKSPGVVGMLECGGNNVRTQITVVGIHTSVSLMSNHQILSFCFEVVNSLIGFSPSTRPVHF